MSHPQLIRAARDAALFALLIIGPVSMATQASAAEKKPAEAGAAPQQEPPVKPGKMPSYADGQKVGEWRSIPGSSMAGAAPASGEDFGPLSSRVNAWNALTYKTSTGEVIRGPEGGHADSCDNSVMRNNIIRGDVSSWPWEYLRQPTPLAKVTQNTSHYLDGRPTSRHGYYSEHYRWTDDSLMVIGASAGYGDGNHGFDGVYRFSMNPKILDWDGADTNPNVSWPNNLRVAGMCGQALDPRDGSIFYSAVSFAGMRRLLPNNTVVDSAPISGPESSDWAYYHPAAINTKDDEVVWFGNQYQPGIGGMRLHIGTMKPERIAFTGPCAALVGQQLQCGAMYDPVTNRFYLKTNAAGAVITVTGRGGGPKGEDYWAAEYPTTGKEVPAAANGVFGRTFRVVMPDKSGGMGYLPQHASEIMYLKLW